MDKQQMRLRFAPSPTGPFHIGGARSALFNWLIARKYGGKLVLRIEDTDLERSSRQSEENIKEALKWLGISWDEGIDVGGEYGPYRQTERLTLYSQYTTQLLENDQAYYCYCSEEELEVERQQQMTKGETPHYSGRCRHLSEGERSQLEMEGRKPVVRFRVPENQEIVINDIVRGTVTFESNGIGDFVIVKSDGIPVYNYAVVLDDALMKITHVIRAEEHLSNTPRQVLIYQALGLTTPVFGHISLILGADRSKMSKRHGATAVEQYRNRGYLPEAVVNFLALLGWSPTGDQEIFSVDELIGAFSMERLAKNPAVFDIDKLNWLNAHYIRKASPDSILELALPHLVEAGFVKIPISSEERVWLTSVVATVQEYISYAAQVVEHAAIFFTDTVVIEDGATREVLVDPDVPRVMNDFRTKLAALETLDEAAVKAVLKSITKELKLGGKKVYMPIRVALTGQMHGPDLPRIIVLMGKEKVFSLLEGTLNTVIG